MRVNVLALSCLFPNAEQPSYGIFVLNRLKAVSRLCNVRVVAPIPVYPLFDRMLRGRPRNAREVPGMEQIEQLEVHHPRFVVIPRVLKWLDALTYLFAVYHVVRKIERQAQFESDLIDVHWTYPDSVAGYWLARRRRRKFLVTVRGKEALYPGEKSLRRWLLTYCLRRADAVVTLSDELKDLVIQLGVDRERVRTILNGVDRSRFMLRPVAECRQRLGLPQDRKIVISVGSLVERKGHHELVKIMPELSRAHAVSLYIIGGPGPEGDLSAMLRGMIAERGLTNVHLVNKVDHGALGDWYGAADLFCLATKGEGCPNVVLEALACGTPVVSTDVGAIRELVTDGVNGFVVDSGKAEILRPVVDKALTWSWDRPQIAQGMDRWGWAKCAEQVIATYRAVLEAKA